MKPIIKNTSISFRQSGFTGGRNECKGNGFVNIEFSSIEEYQEIELAVTDNLTSLDGHWSPLTLSLINAEILRDWLSNSINQLKQQSEEL